MQTIWEQFLKTTWYEMVGMITALLYPIFSSLEKKICWLFGAISSIIYIHISLSGNLYSEVILNGFYVIMAITGYLMWTGVIHIKKKDLYITRLSFKGWIISLALVGSYTAISGFLFDRYTNASFPYLDSFTVGSAFMATWLQARKKIDNWYIFLVVEVLSIWLFWQKGYLLTSVLYFIYCFICVFAIIEWSKKMKLYRLQ